MVKQKLCINAVDRRLYFSIYVMPPHSLAHAYKLMPVTDQMDHGS